MGAPASKSKVMSNVSWVRKFRKIIIMAVSNDNDRFPKLGTVVQGRRQKLNDSIYQISDTNPHL